MIDVKYVHFHLAVIQSSTEYSAILLDIDPNNDFQYNSGLLLPTRCCFRL